MFYVILPEIQGVMLSQVGVKSLEICTDQLQFGFCQGEIRREYGGNLLHFNVFGSGRKDTDCVTVF